MDNPSKVLLHVLLEYGKDKKWLANELGITLQSVRNKFSRNTWTLEKMEEVLKLFDAELVVMTKEGKIFR